MTGRGRLPYGWGLKPCFISPREKGRLVPALGVGSLPRWCCQSRKYRYWCGSLPSPHVGSQPGLSLVSLGRWWSWGGWCALLAGLGERCPGVTRMRFPSAMGAELLWKQYCPVTLQGTVWFLLLSGFLETRECCFPAWDPSGGPGRVVSCRLGRDSVSSLGGAAEIGVLGSRCTRARKSSEIAPALEWRLGVRVLSRTLRWTLSPHGLCPAVAQAPGPELALSHGRAGVGFRMKLPAAADQLRVFPLSFQVRVQRQCWDVQCSLLEPGNVALVPLMRIWPNASDGTKYRKTRAVIQRALPSCCEAALCCGRGFRPGGVGVTVGLDELRGLFQP